MSQPPGRAASGWEGAARSLLLGGWPFPLAPLPGGAPRFALRSRRDLWLRRSHRTVAGVLFSFARVGLLLVTLGGARGDVFALGRMILIQPQSPWLRVVIRFA